MYFTVRKSVRRMAFGVGLVLMPLLCPLSGMSVAHAADVETYVDQVLQPDGSYSVNRPLKAGELKLVKQPKAETKKKSSKLQPPELPVGNVAAPQISKSPYSEASKAAAQAGSSSASVMMSQGLRIVLQKAGQNPDLPKSEPVAEEGALAATSTATSAPVSLTSSDQTLKAPEGQGGKYQPGQEPRNLGTGLPQAQAAHVKETAEAVAPTLAPSAVSSAPVAETAKSSKSTSIFGSPVDDEEDDFDEEEEVASAPAAVSAPAPSAPAATSAPTLKGELPAKPCEPSVTSWTKNCADAGYSSAYEGTIAGETRVVCPGGEVQDVWLSNTCASPDSAKKKDKAKQAEKKAEVAETAIPSATTKDIDVDLGAKCGSANGSSFESEPSAGLCAAGMPSGISGSGPWYWNCIGKGVNAAVSCAASVTSSSSAPSEPKSAAEQPAVQSGKKVSGSCGSADGVKTGVVPKTNLCSSGTPSAINGSGPWYWTCSGSGGGSASNCTAPFKLNAVCGKASTTGHSEAPSDELCSSGTPSKVKGKGPWTWTCEGSNGGEDASCSAGMATSGVCGSANGNPTDKEPSDGLCASGKASDVSGSGPWNWECTGSEGGSNVSCTAPLVEKQAAPAAVEEKVKSPFAESPKTTTSSDIMPAPAASAAIPVTKVDAVAATTKAASAKDAISNAAAIAKKKNFAKPAEPVASAPTTPAPSLATPPASPAPTLAAPPAAEAPAPAAKVVPPAAEEISVEKPLASGSCGKADGAVSAKAPTTDLCSSGFATEVTGSKTSGWNWSCFNSSGSSVKCSAPASTKAGVKAKETPAAQSAPAPTPTQTLSAPAAAPTVATQVSSENDPVCGPVNGQGANSAPKSGLCSSGKPSSVTGEGPWSWACSNESGKQVSCSVFRKVDGACGEANGTVVTTAPTTDLCAAGSATTVSGQGPWIWSCMSSGGGVSVSCSAGVQPQNRVNGVCGKAVNVALMSAPVDNLCESGQPSSVHGNGPWSWTCSGINGGSASVCTNTKVVSERPAPQVDANCGSANGVAVDSKPTDGLCSSGSVTEVRGDGPWNWNCLGNNGGMTVSCTAPLLPPAPIDGSCGAANGVSVLKMPKGSLCNSGIMSSVSGKGPWTWSCSGVNGGRAVSCVAPLDEAGADKMLSAPLPSVVTAPPASKAKGSAKGSSLSAPSTAKNASSLVTPSLSDDKGTTAQVAPSLPANTQPLIPPSSLELPEDTSAAKPAAVNGQLGPSSKFVLDPDLATIKFDKDSDQLSDGAKEIADKLAVELISHVGVRITLVASADVSAGSPRDARRMSLNRALALREYLSGKGVPGGRIDVKALGANAKGDSIDRVEIKVN